MGRRAELRGAQHDARPDEAGESVLFYHSNADPSGVAGVAAVCGPPIDDPTQFDNRSPYFDRRSTAAKPLWQMCQLRFVERFPKVLSLADLRAERRLRGMALLAKGQRLSVQAVSPTHFRVVLALAR